MGIVPTSNLVSLETEKPTVCYFQIMKIPMKKVLLKLFSYVIWFDEKRSNRKLSKQNIIDP